MKILIRHVRKSTIFIVIEILLCVISIYLISENLVATSSFLRDMLIGALSWVLGATLPVWIIGFVHLRSIGMLHHYNRACAISFGLLFAILILSVIWSSIFIIALLTPVVAFNIVGLSESVQRVG